MTVVGKVRCASCTLTDKAVQECYVRKYQYAVILQKCPRETVREPVPVIKQAHDVRSVPVNSLLSMPFQSRTTEDPEIAELVESLKVYGVLEPLLVRRKPSGNLEIVAGARRLAAAKAAGLTEVPVIIKTLTDQESYEIQLIENIQRKDLAGIEKARMLNEMLTRFPNEYPTHETLAFKIGKSREWVTNHLRMLQLDNIVSRETMEKVTEGQAREILSAPAEKQHEIVSRIAETGEVPSMRAIRQTVQPEPVTVSTPGTSSTLSTCIEAPEPTAPKPEPVDVADFTCSVCNQDFRIVHVAHNLHRFDPIRKQEQ